MLDLTILVQWPFLCGLALLSGLLCLLTKSRHKPESSEHQAPTEKATTEPECYPPVEALPSFDWKMTEPAKIFPFKPKYNITMSLVESNVSELIVMDKNYLDRINLRKNMMAEHPELVLAAEDCVKPAVDEFYIWLVGTYLPTRFPSMFEIRESSNHSKSALYSLVNGDVFPLAPNEKTLETLRLMGGLIEDDLLFLVPSDDNDSVTLKGLINCFPSGFDPVKNMNLKLRDIHKSVPKYKEKLEKSMDRFFDKLKVGRFVKRANWTVQTTDQLFIPAGNHIYGGELIPEEEVNINLARVRAERQVLHRLPQTRGLVFSFKTMMYTLSEIKDEGLGQVLADAIDGTKLGNAPEFYIYKRAAVWGKSVKAYLRS